MKHLKKLFESKLENLSGEIESLKYLIEDEGYLVELKIVPQSTNLIDYFAHNHISSHSMYNYIYISVKFPNYSKLKEFYENEGVIEFFERVGSVCDQNKYKMDRPKLRIEYYHQVVCVIWDCYKSSSKLRVDRYDDMSN